MIYSMQNIYNHTRNQKLNEIIDPITFFLLALAKPFKL